MNSKLKDSKNWIATAKTLSEALPYLQRYDGSTIVIKVGGHAIKDPKTLKAFARDLVLIKQCNVNPIVVHGGGPMINEMLKSSGIKSEFKNGKRVTNKKTMNIVEMVLSGKVNPEIVTAINQQGGKALGLSGKDASLMTCEMEDPKMGYVGRPTNINPLVLETFLASDFIPVIAPIGTNKAGETFNVNADTVAGAIASEMKADRLLLLTDVEGVKDKNGEVLRQIVSKEVKSMIESGAIKEGMIPKTQTALEALKNGVRAVVILDGRAPNACLLELFTEHGAGTLIRNS